MFRFQKILKRSFAPIAGLLPWMRIRFARSRGPARNLIGVVQRGPNRPSHALIKFIIRDGSVKTVAKYPSIRCCCVNPKNWTFPNKILKCTIVCISSLNQTSVIHGYQRGTKFNTAGIDFWRYLQWSKLQGLRNLQDSPFAKHRSCRT